MSSTIMAPIKFVRKDGVRVSVAETYPGTDAPTEILLTYSRSHDRELGRFTDAELGTALRRLLSSEDLQVIIDDLYATPTSPKLNPPVERQLTHVDLSTHRYLPPNTERQNFPDAQEIGKPGHPLKVHLGTWTVSAFWNVTCHEPPVIESKIWYGDYDWDHPWAVRTFLTHSDFLDFLTRLNNGQVPVPLTKEYDIYSRMIRNDFGENDFQDA